MADTPIIFSASMIAALLDRRKTMTRRLAWQRPHMREYDFSSEELESFDADGWDVRHVDHGYIEVSRPSLWQHIKSGDRLWVRETWQETHVDLFVYPGEHAQRRDLTYRASTSAPDVGVWRSPIHMARADSRITLIVTSTKIERLHAISDADVIAEGIPTAAIDKFREWFDARDCHGLAFRELWDSLHGHGSFDANPSVVALSFVAHKTNIDQMAA